MGVSAPLVVCPRDGVAVQDVATASHTDGQDHRHGRPFPRSMFRDIHPTLARPVAKFSQSDSSTLSFDETSNPIPEAIGLTLTK